MFLLRHKIGQKKMSHHIQKKKKLYLYNIFIFNFFFYIIYIMLKKITIKNLHNSYEDNIHIIYKKPTCNIVVIKRA